MKPCHTHKGGRRHVVCPRVAAPSPRLANNSQREHHPLGASHEATGTHQTRRWPCNSPSPPRRGPWRPPPGPAARPGAPLGCAGQAPAPGRRAGRRCRTSHTRPAGWVSCGGGTAKPEASHTARVGTQGERQLSEWPCGLRSPHPDAPEDLIRGVQPAEVRIGHLPQRGAGVLIRVHRLGQRPVGSADVLLAGVPAHAQDGVQVVAASLRRHGCDTHVGRPRRPGTWTEGAWVQWRQVTWRHPTRASESYTAPGGLHT